MGLPALMVLPVLQVLSVVQVFTVFTWVTGFAKKKSSGFPVLPTLLVY